MNKAINIRLDEMISDKRIDEVKSGNAEVFSLEQVASQLGLNQCTK